MSIDFSYFNVHVRLSHNARAASVLAEFVERKLTYDTPTGGACDVESITASSPKSTAEIDLVVRASSMASAMAYVETGLNNPNDRRDEASSPTVVVQITANAVVGSKRKK